MKINLTEITNNAQRTLGNYLDTHPIVNTIVLIANHVFRAASMVALMYFMPTPLPATLAICFAASVAYRLTIERFCQYRFAMPSFFGAQAWTVSQQSALALVTGTALQSMSCAASALLQTVPLMLYGLSITFQSYTAAQKNCSRASLCSQKSPCHA